MTKEEKLEDFKKTRFLILDEIEKFISNVKKKKDVLENGEIIYQGFIILGTLIGSTGRFDLIDEGNRIIRNESKKYCDFYDQVSDLH